jgi:hypothetical protein
LKGYVTERVINISDMETLARAAYNDIQYIRNELEKDTPSIDTIDDVSKSLHLKLLKIKDFQFVVERRNTLVNDDYAKPLI